MICKICEVSKDKETKRSACRDIKLNCSKFMLGNIVCAINFLLHDKFAIINRRSMESGSVHSKENYAYGLNNLVRDFRSILGVSDDDDDDDNDGDR